MKTRCPVSLLALLAIAVLILTYQVNAQRPRNQAKVHSLQATVDAFGSHPDAVAMRALAEDIANGKFKIQVDRKFPLAEAAKAHALAEKGGIGKVLLLA